MNNPAYPIIIAILLLLNNEFAFAQLPCQSNHRPIVFVHGFLGSGDNWATQIQRFSSNQYCDDQMYVLDWNTTGAAKRNDSLLNALVDSVLTITHAEKIDLVAHSAGGGLCINFLKDSLHASKVAHYVHIGSGKLKKAAGHSGNIPTLVIGSPDDKVISFTSNPTDTNNLSIPGKDHLEIATCEETFAAIYTFVNNSNQKTTVIAAMDSSAISGRALTLGENSPLKNETIFIWRFNPKTGKRIDKTPFKTLITDSKGYWPEFTVSHTDYLEFSIKPSIGRMISYFFEPQLHTNHFIYIRTLPSSGMVANMMKGLPSDKEQSVLGIFSANKAIIQGRDSLAIDNIALSSDLLTPASATTIAVFLYDDGDGKTSATRIKSMGPGIFMNATDVMIPAGDNKKSSVRLFFNGRRMTLPCRPSEEEVIVAVFN